MGNHFALSTRGIDYLVSQPAASPGYAFLWQLLCLEGCNAVSVDRLCKHMNMDKQAAMQAVRSLLEQGRLKVVDAHEARSEISTNRATYQQMQELSSTGQVMLADMQGLVIACSGFDDDKAGYLAATGSRLLSINETARRRNMDLDNGRPWRLAMRWGTLQVIIQLIGLGEYRFVLIVGGEARLENGSYANLIRMLAGRYINGA